MQTKTEIENWYKGKDPWGYENNPEDAKRKAMILATLAGLGRKFHRALDIGAGEGFITRDLPADGLFAIEWSDTAAKRLPASVGRIGAPEGKYDLIVATGVLYPQYDYLQILKWIKESASGIVLLSNIKSWEVPEVSMLGTPIYECEYPYREYTQKLRVYDFHEATA
jgi:2-polyprenyl-3-methyl-5-hydroxy-6-metoxy-1,4-benzoquinol methylase